MHISFLATLGYLLSVTSAQSIFTPARPPSLPLAVKSPYLSTWFPAGSDGGNGGYLPGQWPRFYTGQVLGWTGLVRVDNETFTWMGAPKGIPLANQKSYEYTSSKSIFTIEANKKVSLKVTFLSPLTPKDLKRQSLTFSYMNVEVLSLDGAEHSVQIYTDISAEWVSGDVDVTAQWDFGLMNDVVYHKLSRQNQQKFSEFNDRAEWGNFYYATTAQNGVTYQSGADDDVRGAFVTDGKLPSSNDTNFRAINDRWPVFGYGISLGSVGASPVSTLFSLGLCQDEAIQFLGADGLAILPSLWKSYFADDLAALTFFHKDYPESSKLSSDLDDRISKDSIAAAGQDYAILTTLAARQAFAATQLVGTGDKHYLFLKEISSNGNTQTVDVIYPASPIFFYTNPDLIKLLLDPHFENQESGHYPNKWATHDLGKHYPNATGHPTGDDEPMPLEECSNNIIMVLAYVQRSGDTDYIKQHYTILRQWAEYLVEDSLFPAEQLSTDDFAGHLANQTNLALKGIIAIEAMSQLSSLINKASNAQNYTKIAHDYITKWQTLGLNTADDPPHAVLNYGNTSTWGLLYNLYNDKLLNTNLVPQSVYNIQSGFYPTVKENYGVPLDTRNRYYTKSDWELFCAAIASEKTRDMFINDLARWVNETPTSRPFTDLYQTSDGSFPPGLEFKARPAVGGLFSLLLLEQGKSGRL
ncbi:glutaminase GtaA [Macroventuria anomochaeta]|uniref:Glutaminase GtaA n=1 Tax=Macroventuria anomochaeta TaxID=301207 RepID=A0ACB6SFK0_9PLEO|nr:glutaminase GtaA [Macroventuria anomochaeta]KAF2633090.1 glutaminase GtaA [Macroventuria anomochaeta]